MKPEMTKNEKIVVYVYVELINYRLSLLAVQTVNAICQFFTTRPLACDPSSLPKYPPSKEIDAKIREEEARR